MNATCIYRYLQCNYHNQCREDMINHRSLYTHSPGCYEIKARKKIQASMGFKLMTSALLEEVGWGRGAKGMFPSLPSPTPLFPPFCSFPFCVRPECRELLHAAHARLVRERLLHRLPAPSWLDSSVGGALHWYRRGHGFESYSDLNFFSGFNFTTA